MVAAWTSADVTTPMRWMLVVTALLAAGAIEALYRSSEDTNPYPWRGASTIFVLYAANVLFLVIRGSVVVDDWYRPVFSVLNISVIVFEVWLLARMVKMRHYRNLAYDSHQIRWPVRERRCGVDRRRHTHPQHAG